MVLVFAVVVITGAVVKGAANALEDFFGKHGNKSDKNQTSEAHALPVALDADLKGDLRVIRSTPRCWHDGVTPASNLIDTCPSDDIFNCSEEFIPVKDSTEECVPRSVYHQDHAFRRAKELEVLQSINDSDKCGIQGETETETARNHVYSEAAPGNRLRSYHEHQQSGHNAEENIIEENIENKNILISPELQKDSHPQSSNEKRTKHISGGGNIQDDAAAAKTISKQVPTKRDEENEAQGHHEAALPDGIPIDIKEAPNRDRVYLKSCRNVNIRRQRKRAISLKKELEEVGMYIDESGGEADVTMPHDINVSQMEIHVPCQQKQVLEVDMTGRRPVGEGGAEEGLHEADKASSSNNAKDPPMQLNFQDQIYVCQKRGETNGSLHCDGVVKRCGRLHSEVTDSGLRNPYNEERKNRTRGEKVVQEDNVSNIELPEERRAAEDPHTGDVEGASKSDSKAPEDKEVYFSVPEETTCTIIGDGTESTGGPKEPQAEGLCQISATGDFKKHKDARGNNHLEYVSADRSDGQLSAEHTEQSEDSLVPRPIHRQDSKEGDDPFEGHDLGEGGKGGKCPSPSPSFEDARNNLDIASRFNSKRKYFKPENGEGIPVQENNIDNAPVCNSKRDCLETERDTNLSLEQISSFPEDRDIPLDVKLQRTILAKVSKVGIKPLSINPRSSPRDFMLTRTPSAHKATCVTMTVFDHQAHQGISCSPLVCDSLDRVVSKFDDAGPRYKWSEKVWNRRDKNEFPIKGMFFAKKLERTRDMSLQPAPDNKKQDVIEENASQGGGSAHSCRFVDNISAVDLVNAFPNENYGFDAGSGYPWTYSGDIDARMMGDMLQMLRRTDHLQHWEGLAMAWKDLAIAKEELRKAEYTMFRVIREVAHVRLECDRVNKALAEEEERYKVALLKCTRVEDETKELESRRRAATVDLAALRRQEWKSDVMLRAIRGEIKLAEHRIDKEEAAQKEDRDQRLGGRRRHYRTVVFGVNALMTLIVLQVFIILVIALMRF